MGTDRTDRESGFTLVELMIVMLIIGVLSAIAFPAYANQSRKARLSALRGALRNAATAEEAVATDNAGVYAPPGAAGLDALRAQGLRVPDSVTLTVVDDDMSLAGHGFCLHAVSVTHPDDELWFASSGDEAGAPSTTACLAT